MKLTRQFESYHDEWREDDIDMSELSKGKARILFNCTTNVIGGGVQNAANFIWYGLHDPDIDWLFAMSPQVAEVLHKWGAPISKKQLVLETPARSIASRKALKAFEAENKVDLVYTMAGPSYVRFRNKHILGVSNPYVTHGGWEALAGERSAAEVVRTVLRTLYRGLHARFEANYWIFQTETSRNGFCQRFRSRRDLTHVVPNAVGKAFSPSNAREPATRRCEASPKRIFCPAADYPHKNLRVIPEISRILVESSKVGPCKFVTTLPNESPTWLAIAERSREYGVSEFVENIGPFSYAEAYRLYHEADVVFIPSILETFSTSYLEAIAVSRPLVVSNREFAREICGRSAIYFEPRSPIDAAQALQRALLDDDYHRSMVAARDEVLGRYGYYDTRYNAITKIVKTIANRNRVTGLN